MRSTLAVAVLLATIAVAGCDRGSRTATEDMTAARSDAIAPSDPERRTIGTMRGIMAEKLVHAHALLEAISLQSFTRVERHADALTELSRRSDWQVHTTLAYGVFSDEFRNITTKLAADARQRDVDAMGDGYVRLVRSCLDCHAYLRREGLIRDTPGRVTMAGPRPAGG
ncbi:MAG: hypothetical protein ACYTJ0_13400 [Planctomycetota bacterium]|jgi:hypothetical protein